MTQFKIEIDYDKASCSGVTDPEVFWPQGPNAETMTTQAKAICATCPEKLTCLSHALQYERDGIWGETTPLERDALRRKQRIHLEPIKYDK